MKQVNIRRTGFHIDEMQNVSVGNVVTVGSEKMAEYAEAAAGMSPAGGIPSVKKEEITGKVADNFFLRLRGLIGRDPKSFGPLLITPCSDIHTFFMSDAIDVIYLDKEYKVLKVARNLVPGKVFGPVRHARSVLELPAGHADKWKIQEQEVWEVKIHG